MVGKSGAATSYKVHTMNEITANDVMKRRDEKDISLLEAKRELTKEALYREIQTAYTVNDLKTVMLKLVAVAI